MNVREIRIRTDRISITGNLSGPSGASGMVIFAHGSGSSRFSQRNVSVANRLHGIGLATLLLDLLTREEEEIDNLSGELRFDIELLGSRVVAAIDWAKSPAIGGEAASVVGLFGASTGAAAALVAAGRRSGEVAAVVSRGGRPDLAHAALAEVCAPTLLIVGGHDPEVLKLNRLALRRLGGIKELAIVPGASHLFEEPGTLDEVAALACDWFARFMAPAQAGRTGNWQ